MNITECMSVYTRGYRLPEKLAKKMKPNSDIGQKLMPQVFSSRYIARNRLSMRELGAFAVGLSDSERSLNAALYGLCHQSGHAVIIIGLKPDSLLSPEDMKRIQEHWKWPSPEDAAIKESKEGGPVPHREIFLFDKQHSVGINDLFDIGYYRLLEDIADGTKDENTARQIDLVKRHDSVEALLTNLGYKVAGFYIPTIFGCVSVLESSGRPTADFLGGEPYAVELNGAAMEPVQSEDHSLLFVHRNAAVVYTSKVEEFGYMHALQLAMLNLVRHYNNFLCGELNHAAELIERKDYKGGALLQKVKSLYEETIYMYDELHNVSLWNNADQVEVSTVIRRGSAWKLEEEVAVNLAKLEHLTTLTTEICKVQGRRGRLFISSLLAGVGFVNLIELIPVWQDYVVQALEVWVPVLTFGVLLVVSVAYLMQKED